MKAATGTVCWRIVLTGVVVVCLLAARPSLAAASSVVSPTVTLTSQAASVSGVSYLVDFTTSSTGALAQNTGTITVALPTGSVIPNEAVQVTDLSTAANLGVAFGPTFTNGRATATWHAGAAVPAGHRIELTIPGVTNPPAGGGQVRVSTSADSTPAGTSPYTLTAPQSISSPTVSLTTPVKDAHGVSYMVGFTTSSTGALAGNTGTITVALPTGSVIPYEAVQVTDLSTAANLGVAFAPTFTNGHATATWLVSSAVPPGDRIEVTIPNVTNAGSGGPVGVLTSSDPGRVNTTPITLTTAQSIFSPTVSLTTPVKDATRRELYGGVHDQLHRRAGREHRHDHGRAADRQRDPRRGGPGHRPEHRSQTSESRSRRPSPTARRPPPG